jgi:hypothetical protein
MFERSVPETDRLGRDIKWIDAGFVERQPTPGFAIRVGIHLHLLVCRSRIPNNISRGRVSSDVEPRSTTGYGKPIDSLCDVGPNQLAVDAVVIRVNE